MGSAAVMDPSGATFCQGGGQKQLCAGVVLVASSAVLSGVKALRSRSSRGKRYKCTLVVHALSYAYAGYGTILRLRRVGWSIPCDPKSDSRPR